MIHNASSIKGIRLLNEKKEVSENNIMGKSEFIRWISGWTQGTLLNPGRFLHSVVFVLPSVPRGFRNAAQDPNPTLNIHMGPHNENPM